MSALPTSVENADTLENGKKMRKNAGIPYVSALSTSVENADTLENPPKMRKNARIRTLSKTVASDQVEQYKISNLSNKKNVYLNKLAIIGVPGSLFS